MSFFKCADRAYRPFLCKTWYKVVEDVSRRGRAKNNGCHKSIFSFRMRILQNVWAPSGVQYK